MCLVPLVAVVAAAVVLDESVDGAEILVRAVSYVGFVTVGLYVMTVGEAGRVTLIVVSRGG